MIVNNNIYHLKKLDFPLKYISDNNQIQEIDENYDGLNNLNNLNNLSFSIYYTFNESFLAIQNSWDIDFSKDRLNDLEIILDNLYDIKEIQVNIETGEQEPNIDHNDNKIRYVGDDNFNKLYDLLCKRFDEHYDLIHQKTCQNVLFKSFSNFCNLLLKSKNYIYKHDLFLIDFPSKKFNPELFNLSDDDNPDDNPDDNSDDNISEKGNSKENPIVID